jgi:hypothetical protein
MNTSLFQIAEDVLYVSATGHTLRREEGTSPNGNPFGMRWVLRDPKGQFIGVDQYRYDLAPRYGFEITDKPFQKSNVFSLARRASDAIEAATKVEHLRQNAVLDAAAEIEGFTA